MASPLARELPEDREHSQPSLNPQNHWQVHVDVCGMNERMDGRIFICCAFTEPLCTRYGVRHGEESEAGDRLRECWGGWRRGACSGKVSVCDTKGSEGERLLGQGIPAPRP